MSHSLHSLLMNITNAISEMSEVDGMFQLDGGLIPYTTPQTLVTIAVILSVVNVVGGILIIHKMLELFRKEDSSQECCHCLKKANDNYCNCK